MKKTIIQNFNPRIPRGMRRDGRAILSSRHVISIHASREGCDEFIFYLYLSGHNFNPRIPRGMRRIYNIDTDTEKIISIHASREGCDNVQF